LRAALKLFWEKGYADTSLQELEKVTGVNKSGLYSEFSDKLDLFLNALRFYLANRNGREILSSKPLGFANIQKFLEISDMSIDGCRGCFSVNSMREVRILPKEAVEIIEERQAEIRKLLVTNIRAARSDADAAALADLTLTFFSGLCIEQNLPRSPEQTKRQVRRFMKMLEQA
jgi:TetR/AcrR family transcriptional regulator, copper-responsive repressor